MNYNQAINVLTRAAGKEFYECETDNEKIKECIALLEQLYPHKVIMICRRRHSDWVYAGGNSTELWGYSTKMLQEFSPVQLINLIHPDDRQNVLWGLNRLLDFYNEANPADLKFTFVYRVKTADDNYIHVQDERIAIKTSNNNFAYFNIFSKVDQHSGPVTLQIWKRISDKLVVKVQDYTIQPDSDQFSPRERNVIDLIEKGFNNIQIAEALSVSVFTVKNHKQRMFRKTKSKNTLELLRYAQNQSAKVAAR